MKELNDEVAASCSGGGTVAGPDPDVILYKDPDGMGLSEGLSAVKGDGVSNVGLLGTQDTTFNDQTSSIRVIRGTWSFFQDANYGGDNTGLLAPGLYNLGHNNDAITSAFRNA
ncbi:MAG: hypothetical protein HWQ41_30740 [Nostoc sp. NOS(2021)]|uniref:beta/gamma crystallin-related protein n=1 Tax=Nostoc sp. NOS(2021) TaxID=2815407 RepID=UPI0025EB516B|nr:beta/gamma crystallin-related protein [Nostoc sp. NOS(2021)]MBN3899487.1 hypothetical protein [Nostoc sp. NOS(2021)]